MEPQKTSVTNYSGISLQALISTACSSSTKLRHTGRAAVARNCASSPSAGEAPPLISIAVAASPIDAALDEARVEGEVRKEELQGVTHNITDVAYHKSRATNEKPKVGSLNMLVTRYIPPIRSCQGSRRAGCSGRRSGCGSPQALRAVVTCARCLVSKKCCAGGGNRYRK